MKLYRIDIFYSRNWGSSTEIYICMAENEQALRERLAQEGIKEIPSPVYGGVDFDITELNQTSPNYICEIE